jgi:hypothetical protein
LRRSDAWDVFQGSSLLSRRICIPKNLRLSGGISEEVLDQKNVMGNHSIQSTFRVKVPHTKPGDVVKVVGGTESMGCWQRNRALTLTTSEIDFPW